MTTTRPPTLYVEPPTIPEGMTIAEYRCARLPRNKPLSRHLLDWLAHLAGVRDQAVGCPAAIAVVSSSRRSHAGSVRAA